ncbi:hypothetical protein I3760_03G183300 [Carya illinoinensis]|nr:hypothetical protein I3760_03G183300 [Carya illinoinensis]
MTLKVIALKVVNLVSAALVVTLTTQWTIVGDIHGRPSRSANQTICQDATSLSMSSNQTPKMISISKDEYDQLLGCTRAALSSIATLAHSGIVSACLVSSTQNPWIIDSRANEHLTNLSYSLSKLDTMTSPKSVTLTDGYLAEVTGIGSTNLIDSISLSYILYAPSFPFSFLFISKITQNLQYSVTFYPYVCIFLSL